MDAVEFVKTIKRMLNTAPIESNHVITSFVEPEKEVARIEEWAKEHPIKTRQSIFLEHYPNAKLDEKEGILVFFPCDVDKKMRKEDCPSKSCYGCRREFWEQVVK